MVYCDEDTASVHGHLNHRMPQFVVDVVVVVCFFQFKFSVSDLNWQKFCLADRKPITRGINRSFNMRGAKPLKTLKMKNVMPEITVL